MQQQGSNNAQPEPERVKLEDRYKAIGIPALAAALGVGRSEPVASRPQMSAEQPAQTPKAGGQS
ncbi:MAG: hypothetical protein ACK50Q_17390 [Labrys sp. (in: a-proteobacteria)]